MKKFMLALVLALISSGAAANTITVTPTPVIGGFNGVSYIWAYAVTLEGNSQINTGDFFTIFDFAGLVAGSQNTQPGWTASTLNTGACPAQAPFPALCAVADDPLTPNLTWTRTGAAILGPGANNPPAFLGLFGARSIYNTTRNDFYVSQDQDNQNIPPTPNEGAGGNTNVPNPIPEPATLVLLGSGLLYLSRRRLARFTN